MQYYYLPLLQSDAKKGFLFQSSTPFYITALEPNVSIVVALRQGFLKKENILGWWIDPTILGFIQFENFYCKWFLGHFLTVVVFLIYFKPLLLQKVFEINIVS